MTQEVTCPYCEEDVNIDLDDFEDGQIYHEECPKCGKVLNINVSIEVEFIAEKCECQLENHRWRKMMGGSFGRMYCGCCGQMRDMTDEEAKESDVITRTQYLKSLREQ